MLVGGPSSFHFGICSAAQSLPLGVAKSFWTGDFCGGTSQMDLSWSLVIKLLVGGSEGSHDM